MDLNRNNIKRLKGLILFTIVALVVGINYKSVFGVAGRWISFTIPFLLGASIAFVLNVPMRRIEKCFSGWKNSGLKRILSLCLTLVLVLGILSVVIFLLVPQLSDTIRSLQRNIPGFLMQLQVQAETLFAQSPEVAEYVKGIQLDWDSIFSRLFGFLTSGAGTVLTSTVSAAMSIVSGFTTFFIGLIFAIYILLQKETLGRQAGKLLRAFLPDQMTDRTLGIAALTERTFSNFLTGQCVEAVILGTMFFVALTILRMPYALLIGVLIAFTALIPIFGAFIGCAVGAFLLLMVSPAQALLFIVVFLVLQQIEGNLIYPHVVGGSIGLPSIWVLVAVTVGGSAMGILGMLIFIPLCSVLYTLLREAVNRRLAKKNRAG